MMARAMPLLPAREVDDFQQSLGDEIPSQLDDHQLQVLKAVSLGVASISVASAVLAFYWFLRMRRSFRHDLIMLVIQSDMFKALWYMLFPIVEFAAGPIHGSSAFCQASGFFLSVGIEASDIAILMIALHTALYIFRPRGSRGERGLYPYRRISYGVFILMPIILASLAFLNQPFGYVNNGEYCYLPLRPSWPRLALSWVPRYIIFFVILLIYSCIYGYVTLLMRRYAKVSAMRRASGGPLITETGGGARPIRLPPPTLIGAGGGDVPDPMAPPVAYHSLNFSGESSRRGSAAMDPRERQSSVSTVSTIKMDDLAMSTAENEQVSVPVSPCAVVPMSQSAIRWTTPNFRPDNSQVSSHKASAHGDGTDLPRKLLPSSAAAAVTFAAKPLPASKAYSMSPATTATAQDSTTASTAAAESLSPGWHDQPGGDSEPSSPASATRGFWHRQLSFGDKAGAGAGVGGSRRASTLPLMLAALWHGPGPGKRSSTMSTESSSMGGTFLHPSTSSDVGGMAKTRDKIRRQLRLLFIYPLVYLAIWLVPFVAHILRWDDPTHGGPYAVLLLSAISTSIQGAVNAWLFSTREKPWRHGRGRGCKGRREGGGDDDDNDMEKARRQRWSLMEALRYCAGREGGEELGLGLGLALGRGRGRGDGRTIVGRTHDEMVVDGVHARLRREKEMAELRRMGRQDTGRGKREWWDGLEADERV